MFSPTSGQSYAALGQVAPLNCHKAERLPRPSSASPPPELNTPTDLSMPGSTGREAVQPARPSQLSLARGACIHPPPLLEPAPAPVPLPYRHTRLPSESSSPARPTQLLPSDLTVTVRQERPTALPGPPALFSAKMERLDRLLRAVAASPAQLSPAQPCPVQPSAAQPSSAELSIQPSLAQNTASLTVKEEPGGQGEGGGDVSPGRRGGPLPGTVPGEQDKRVMRRERNKQAAARCRKRRLDLTCSLQVGSCSLAGIEQSLEIYILDFRRRSTSGRIR